MKNGQDFLKRMRALPEFKKKIIVWGVTICIGIAMLAWWIPRMSERLQIQQGPSIEEQPWLHELQEQVKIPEVTPFQSNDEQ